MPPCPICLFNAPTPNHGPGALAVERTGRVDGSTFDWSCPRCGCFSTIHEFVTFTARALSEQQRTALSGAIRQATDAHVQLREVLMVDGWQRVIDAAAPPRGVLEQMDRLLLAVADRTAYYNDWTPAEPAQAWIARGFCPDWPRFLELWGALCRGRLDWLEQKNGGEFGPIQFRLTIQGWHEVDRRRSERGTGSQAFVAMWFHAEMTPIFDQGIVPALKATGWNPYRADRAPNNNRIDDEIVAQIRKSALLVADVTGDRAGVYYEAGLAQGLGIPVIWCCNQSWKARLPKAALPNSTDNPEIDTVSWVDRMHFDTRQFPHILWTDAHDLRKQLGDRIEALGLGRPKVANKD